SLANTCARWVCTVRRETYRRWPICGLDSPSETRSTTARSLGVRLSQPLWARLWLTRRPGRLRLRLPGWRLAIRCRARPGCLPGSADDPKTADRRLGPVQDGTNLHTPI